MRIFEYYSKMLFHGAKKHVTSRTLLWSILLSPSEMVTWEVTLIIIVVIKQLIKLCEEFYPQFWSDSVREGAGQSESWGVASWITSPTGPLPHSLSCSVAYIRSNGFRRASNIFRTSSARIHCYHRKCSWKIKHCAGRKWCKCIEQNGNSVKKNPWIVNISQCVLNFKRRHCWYFWEQYSGGKSLSKICPSYIMWCGKMSFFLQVYSVQPTSINDWCQWPQRTWKNTVCHCSLCCKV